MSIRLMEQADLQVIASLEKELFLAPWNQDDFLNELTNNPFARYYVLEKKHLIKGYIGLWMMGVFLVLLQQTVFLSRKLTV